MVVGRVSSPMSLFSGLSHKAILSESRPYKKIPRRHPPTATKETRGGRLTQCSETHTKAELFPSSRHMGKWCTDLVPI